MTRPTLSLLNGDVTIALAHRAIAIGRLPECDVVLDGWEVSRRHARIVPTPAGPLIVDRSRFGTFVNQIQVIAPLLLTEGDVIRVGRNELRVVMAPGTVLRPSGSGVQGKLARWWQRYGISELGGTVAAVVGAALALRAGAGIAMVALAGTLAEILWFYGSLALRDLQSEARARHAVGRRLDRRGAADVFRNLAREFGAAEAVDLAVRPLCLGVGLATIGGIAGVLIGKLAADVLFYGPILSACHWRLAGRAPQVLEPHRLRQTSALPMPVSQLADLHRQLDTQDTTPQPELPPTYRVDR